MTPVAPRTVNDVSYVMRTIRCESFCVTGVAGAVLGDVQVALFVAGAVFGESLTVRLGAKRCILQ